jgi:hypothetical protein
MPRLQTGGKGPSRKNEYVRRNKLLVLPRVTTMTKNPDGPAEVAEKAKSQDIVARPNLNLVHRHTSSAPRIRQRRPDYVVD